MANADFSREQNQTPGGFDSGSYREAKRPDTEAVRLTPLQQKLAGLEKALPAALAKQGTALVLSVAIMLAAFVGFGGAKVRGKYNEARQWFTTGVSADNGYALSEELTTRANTAANIITTGANTLGADSAEMQAAQAALDDFSACLEAVQNGSKKQSLTSLPYYQGSAMHALYQANEALGTVIDQLYAKMQEQAADPMKMGAVQGQYGQFNSAGTIIGNLQYNDAVYEYQTMSAASRPVCWAGCSAYRRWNPSHENNETICRPHLRPVRGADRQPDGSGARRLCGHQGPAARSAQQSVRGG